MPVTESDTRAKLIAPALHARGWTENLIRREETAGAIELDSYAFKCTASGGGAQDLAELRGATRSHFIATTVDLLTSGVNTLIVSEPFVGLEQGKSGDKQACLSI